MSSAAAKMDRSFMGGTLVTPWSLQARVPPDRGCLYLPVRIPGAGFAKKIRADQSDPNLLSNHERA